MLCEECLLNNCVQNSCIGLLWHYNNFRNKPPLKRVTPHGVGRCPQGRGDRSVRGEPAKLVEGFLWNLLLGVKGLRDNPSVTCGDSSPKGEPDNKASPLGEGDRRQTVEGFFVKSFAWCKRFVEVPLSHLR